MELAFEYCLAFVAAFAGFYWSARLMMFIHRKMFVSLADLYADADHWRELYYMDSPEDDRTR